MNAAPLQPGTFFLCMGPCKVVGAGMRQCVLLSSCCLAGAKGRIRFSPILRAPWLCCQGAQMQLKAPRKAEPGARLRADSQPSTPDAGAGQEPHDVPQALGFWLEIRLSQGLSCHYPLPRGVCGDTMTFGCGGRRELLLQERSFRDHSQPHRLQRQEHSELSGQPIPAFSQPDSLFCCNSVPTEGSLGRVPMTGCLWQGPHSSALEAPLAEVTCWPVPAVALHCTAEEMLDELPAAPDLLVSLCLSQRWICEEGPFITRYTYIYFGPVFKHFCF